MKKEMLLGLIFLGSLWGAVEVFLGDFLYSIGWVIFFIVLVLFTPR